MTDNLEHSESHPDVDVRGPIIPRSAVHRVAAPMLEPGGETPLDVDAGADQAAPVGDLVAIVSRARRLILCVFVLISATVVPLIWWKVSPMYRATALVRVSPVVSRIVFKTEDNGIVPLFWSYLNTQVSIIQSATVLGRVLDREDVRQTGWYRGDPDATSGGEVSQTIESLLESFTAEPKPKTELIEIAMVAENPRDARVVVDAIVDEFMKFTEANLTATDKKRFETLSDEVVTLRQEIDGLRATRHSLTEDKDLGTADPQELRTLLSTERSTLESESETLRREASLTRWELQALREVNSDGNGEKDEDATGSPPTRVYAADPEWRSLKVDLETTQHRLKVAGQRYGEHHPEMKKLISNVAYGRRMLKERERQLDAGLGGLAITSLPTAMGSAAVPDANALARKLARQQKELELREAQLARLDRRAAKIGNLSQRIEQIDQEIEHKVELYRTVRSRLTALELEGKAPARIGVASFATEPSKPYKDSRRKYTALTLVGALMLGLMLAVLRARFDPKIREARDVEGNERVPFLGQLLRFPDRTDLLAECHPAIVEGIRMVRTAMLRRLDGTEKRVILITSSSRDSGKTSVAVLLAKSLAQLGRRTLLVEADLRRPSLSRRLGFDAPEGLASVLTNPDRKNQPIVPTGIDGLDVLPAGEPSERFDFELLANGVFASCLKRWRTHYDYILLDSPPVLPVADARILAGHADGTIMVLRASHSRRADVVRAYADLSAAGGTLLGTVLVGVTSALGDGYYDGYQTYGMRLPAPQVEA